MRIEYYLTPKRVIQCQVHLRETMCVENVLNECVWFPPVVRVHIETRRCCREPQYALDGSTLLTDPRLARFVALEDSVFQTTCHACGAVKTTESTDLSLLHWRSVAEVRYWRSMPWFAQVMERSTCTLANNGQEELWSSMLSGGGPGSGVDMTHMDMNHVLRHVIVNQAPTQMLPVTGDVTSQFKELFTEVVPLVRQCVHFRLWPTMRWLTFEGKVYVAFRQKRENGYYFVVKQRERCVSWPREYIGSEDCFPVVTAARCALGAVSLTQFMQLVVQVIHVGESEFMVVVNWPSSVLTEPLPDHVWCHESKVQHVHGMSVKYPGFALALGTTRPVRMFHGTSMSAGKSIWSHGFESNAFHGCSGSYYKCCPPFACSCKGMLGPGIYTASFDKAAANAGRVSGAHTLGMVLECQVLAGECKFVTPYSVEYCQCGCDSFHSDHVATWYHDQLFDSVMLCSGAGVKRQELCVRRPQRVQPVEQWYVKFNDRRERIYTSKHK